MQGSSNSSLASPSMASPVPGADDPAARRIVVAHRLPLRAAPDPDSPLGFAFSLDPDALPLQLSRGLPAAVTFVGTMPASAASAAPSDELDDYLMKNFSCLPVHLDSDCHARFYDTFCKRYLWPQLHYMLPLASAQGVFLDDAAYRAFLAANRRFADRVVEVLSPDDGDLVIVHDYHLWVLPTFLRRKCPRAGIGFFLHSPFPSADIFRAIAAREDLVRALLNADLVGFHTFDYAGHFLSCCSRLLGVSGRPCRGHMAVDYHGRTVLVKVLPVGVDVRRLRAAVASPEAAAKAKELADAYRGRKLVVGVDDVDRLKGVSEKLEALEKLLETCGDMRGQVVLVQINNPARSRGVDVDGVRQHMDLTRERINRRFGSAGYEPVVMIDGPVPMSEKAAYYAAADCCVVSAVRDGLNRIPYFYTACREEGPAGSGTAENGGDAASQRTSVVVVSEFAGCSPSLGGAIRVNPFSVEALAEAMHAALTMRTEEKQSRHRRNYSYLASHDVVAWARSFDASLRVACQGRSTARLAGLGLGMSYHAVAFDDGFRKLVPEHAGPAYRAAARRLIVLEYDGALVGDALAEGQKVPNAGLIDLVSELCSDPKNVVFLVSGRAKDQLAEWFSPCEKLGISAEHGNFTRWSREDTWVAHKLPVAGIAWKETAEAVMSHYTLSTDGSKIEKNESTVVWDYKNVDSDLGDCQTKELFHHLENVLAREPVLVTRSGGRRVVEVNLQGVTNGVAVEGPISTMMLRGDVPDFVLCIGHDERMFETLAGMVDHNGVARLLPVGAQVFTCTVGQTSSKAALYLDNPAGVLDMLRGLLATCSPRPRPVPIWAADRRGLFEIISLM